MPVLKRNSLVYFYSYLIVQSIFIIINVILPIYFFNILDVNRIELAFIQIFSYLALFSKPILSIYFDKREVKRKILLLISVFIIVVNFFFIINSFLILILFGIFLAINFSFISLLDIIIDKSIIIESDTEAQRSKNAFLIQIGSMVGAILPNVLFLMLISDLNNLSEWNYFFLTCALILIPILPLALFFNEQKKKEISEIQPIVEPKEINKKTIILLSFFLFLVYSDKIYEYPFEPWALNKYLGGDVALFTGYFILVIIFNAIGVVLASLISKKYDRKKLVISVTLITGILNIILPFQIFIIFFVLILIGQILAGFIVINVISLMIYSAKDRVTIFQIMSSFIVLASVVFIPLGTYLSSLIATEFLFAIAGVLTLISTIPLLLIDEDFNISENPE